ncbi:MAG: transcriptional repressor [Pseudomonadota bacterium]|nr:transcriptional repressor [Pseudomonadota bacterium]
MANRKTLSGGSAAFHGTRHTHARCIGRALGRAEELCRQRGARLTYMRRRVLELIWDSHKAVKAYDLLDRLSDSEKSVRPPTVYRALEFLMAHGLVHRVDSLNAFVGCSGSDEHHNAQFLICQECGEVSEMDGAMIGQAVARQAAEAGFNVRRQMVELHGECPGCAAK